MGQSIQISTSRMQCIGAYLAQPQGKPKGGIVIVQEIFGVTSYVRSVADRYAADGYTAIAPAFFDHVETNVQLPYDQTGIQRGRELIGEVSLELAATDVASAAQSIASAGRIGCIGFCWGGTVALLAATRLGMPAVSYYGSRNVNYLDEPLKAPAMFHFGARDPSIPAEAIERHRTAYPQAQVYVYPTAGHAFDRDVDPHVYDADGAKLARERTLAFFAQHLAAAPA